MERPLQIVFHGVDSSAAMEAHIRERADRLGRYYDRLTGCRVVLEAPHNANRPAAASFVCKVEVDIPARPMITGSGEGAAGEDASVVVNQAFAAAERQLKDIAELRTDSPKHHESEGESGQVVRLFPEQGYGFIEIPSSPNLYFSRNAVVGGSFEDIEIGTIVLITIATGEGPMGPQASSVRVLNKRHSPA